MAPAEPVPPIIRNQRVSRWPGLLAVALGGCLWIVVCGYLLFGGSFAGPETEPVLILVAVVASVSVALVVVRLQPIERVVLTDELVISPELRRHPPADVRDIAFAPDPHEDYAESALPIKLCQATVSPVRGRAVTLIVSAGDAARLRDWAERKGIAVRDPDGYSAQGARPDPT